MEGLGFMARDPGFMGLGLRVVRRIGIRPPIIDNHMDKNIGVERGSWVI